MNFIRFKNFTNLILSLIWYFPKIKKPGLKNQQRLDHLENLMSHSKGPVAFCGFSYQCLDQQMNDNTKKLHSFPTRCCTHSPAARKNQSHEKKTLSTTSRVKRFFSNDSFEHSGRYQSWAENVGFPTQLCNWKLQGFTEINIELVNCRSRT